MAKDCAAISNWLIERGHVPGATLLDAGWEATKERKQREPLFRKGVATDRGRLTFTSITDVDPESHRLLVSETHTLDDGAGEQSRQYQFIVRCWTRRELHAALTRFGFGTVAYFGAFDPAIEAGATDRLIAVASLTRATVS